MNIDLTATYTASYVCAILNFMSDGTVNYEIAGDVTDEELDAMIAAGGGEVPGFSVCLS